MEGENSTEEPSDVVYLFAFMPLPEANGVLLGELGHTLDIAELRSYWLDRTTKIETLARTDPYVIDDSNLVEIEKGLDESLKEKIDSIEGRLKAYSIWKTTPHAIKLVEIDKLIALQNHINLNRVRKIAEHLSSDSSTEELLDLCFDFDRPSVPISYGMTANNTYVFTSEDEDVRIAQPTIRMLPRYDTSGDTANLGKLPSLLIQATAGDPFIYALKTHVAQQIAPGVVLKRYQFTLQNGFHRAYAMRERGFRHMPCLVVDPISSNETALLGANWPPERLAQITTQRPPLMKDFFNQDLTEAIKVPRRKIVWKISWGIEKFLA